MRRNDAAGLAVGHRKARQSSVTIATRGSLFTPDFLTDSIRDLDDWKTLAEDDSDRLRDAVEEIFTRFPISQRPNETQTEQTTLEPFRIGQAEIHNHPLGLPSTPVSEEDFLPPAIVHPSAGGDSHNLSTESG